MHPYVKKLKELRENGKLLIYSNLLSTLVASLGAAVILKVFG